MIVIRMLLGLLALGIIGLIITQYIVPTLKDERTWSIFRRNSTKKTLQELYIQLSEAKDEQEAKQIKKEIQKLKK